MASMTTATPLAGDDQESVPAGSQHSSGSIGPFFAVISVIIVLTVLSCIFGRVCAAQVTGPDAWYDCQGWARRRCMRNPFRSDVVREAKAAVAAELDQKPKESQQLSLPQP